MSAHRAFVVAVAAISAQEDLQRWLRAVKMAASEAAVLPGVSEVEVVLGLPRERAVDFPSGDSANGSALTVVELDPAESVPAALNSMVFGLSEPSAQDAILLLDPRCLPARDAFLRLINDVADEECGLTQARHIPFEGYQRFDPDTREMSWAMSSAVATRVETFAAVGGFDTEHFSTFLSDVDLSWRVIAGGWRIRYCPDAVVFKDQQFGDDVSSWRATPGDGGKVLDHLNLLRRFGTADLLREALAEIAATGNAAHVAAADAFRASVRENTAPELVSGAEEVALFGGDFYGDYRFAE